jgi:hypothetical protein
MSTEVAEKTGKQLSRPLHVLVPLIKDDLKHVEEAGLPYKQAAGAKLIEAKSQLKHGEWFPWLERNFALSKKTAQTYMNFAETMDGSKTKNLRFSSLNEFHRETGSSNYRSVTSKRDWHEPVKQILGRVDIETLRDTELKRADERIALKKLKLQLIDIGFKALATKLHPDKGGSRDAMARLNQARNELKASV